MRKLIYTMSVSLDGYIEDQNGSIDFTFPDEDLHLYFNEMDRAIGTYLYGRRLYETMSAFWPFVKEDESEAEVIKQYSRQWNAKEKIVFSNTLTQVDWNSTLFRGDPVGEIKRLKELPGLDISVGGSNLAATFIQNELVDEYNVFIFPFLLGGGKPMFPHFPKQQKLALLSTKRFFSGVILLSYRRE